jgi:hypothetical protein
MAASDAKAYLNQGVGEPATGFVSTADVKAAIDVIYADTGQPAPGLAVWSGTAWPSRPAVASGVPVEWWSVTDAAATPPAGAIAGDVWRRAPGASA